MPKWQEDLITQIVASLKRNYVFADVIFADVIFADKKKEKDFTNTLRRAFTAKFSNAKYSTEPNNKVDGEAFALEAKRILVKITGDEHFFIEYDPDLIAKQNADPEFLKEFKFTWSRPSQPFPEDKKEKWSKGLRERGCGYYDMTTDIETIISSTDDELKAKRRTELERDRRPEVKIPDNVGYFGMFMVANPKTFEVVREKIFDTMQGMQNKKAIILDLRGNTGGSPEGVRYLLSYLLKEPTHINTIRTREGNEFKEEKFETYSRNSDELIPASRRGQIVPDLSDKPLYVLVDKNTFSAGEEIVYNLQQSAPYRLGKESAKDSSHSVTIIGETTRGGAHPTTTVPLFNDASTVVNSLFILGVPYATSINPISDTNWEDGPEGKGVNPKIPVPAEQALRCALTKIEQDLLTVHRSLPPRLSTQAHPLPALQFSTTPAPPGLLASDSQPTAKAKEDKKTEPTEPRKSSVKILKI